MKKKKKLIIVAAAVILGSIGFAIYQFNQPLPVHTVQLEKINYEENHYEEGEVASKERMTIFSPGSGNVNAVEAEEGDYVDKGERILSIDTEDLKYELDTLYAQRASLLGQQKSEGEGAKDSEIRLQEESIVLAKNKVATSEKELERYTQLFENEAIGLNDFEASQDRYKQAVGELNIENFKLKTLKESGEIGSGTSQYYKGQIAKIDSQIKQVKKKMADMDVMAPISGILAKFSLDQGDYVSENQDLFEIFRQDLYEIETYVLVKEVKSLEIGMTAYIEIENQNKIESIEGEITFIAPSAVELISPLGLIEKKVKVRIIPDEVADFINGEKVDVKFVTYQKSQAQVLSKDYVFPWEEGEAVWIIDEGKAKILKINEAFDSSTIVVLADEMDEKTEIIIPPYPDSLEEGVAVKER